MQVTFRNVDSSNNVVAADATLIADENTVKTILESTFFDNITLTFNVCLGFNNIPNSRDRGLRVTGSGVANANGNAEVTYGALRTALLNGGQPNFFTATNLPAGDNLPGSPLVPRISNFWISTSQAKALGLPRENRTPDGFIGIGFSVAPGPDRVATLLHEVGHAMGRLSGTASRGAVIYYPEFDLMRFSSAGNRITDEGGGGYFSLDGGATRLRVTTINAQGQSQIVEVNWSTITGSDFADPADLRDFGPRRLDPYNATGVDGNNLAQLTPVDIQLLNALGFNSPVNNPALLPGTSGVMVLRGTSDPNNDTFVIYDLGNNATLGGFTLGRLPSDSQFVTLGRFNDGDTSDMLLQTNGVFQIYDIVNNTITRTASLGPVGDAWQVLGFGGFGGIVGNSDMLLRNTNPATLGALQVYNISNNAITGSVPMGAIGLEWQFAGVGNFSSSGTASDLLMLRPSDGALQLYDIANNRLGDSFFLGAVGPGWQFSGVGNFSSNPGESDLMLRRTSDGARQIYDIANNRLGDSFALTAVGTEWQFAGVAPIRGAGPASDLVLRRAGDGAFQVYNIANNQQIGTPTLFNPGAQWQLGGFAPAAGPPGGAMASAGSSDDLLGSSSQPTAMDGSTAQAGTSTFQLADANGNAASMVNPTPPDATTANMVLRNASNPAATYQIYNLGANTTLAGSSVLGQVGSEWGFVAIGNFNLDDPSDMLLRNSTSGEFQAYEIVDNNVISSNSMGAVGSNWQVMGFGIFGPFSGPGETDMMLRDANTGDLEAYDIFDNEIVDIAPLGNIGLQWQFSGIGNWGSSGNSDLLVRNSTTGELQVHNISNNEITGSESLGTVGTEWQFSGVGTFSSFPDESGLLLRNSNTGELKVYNISNNEITGSESLGKVGLEWQFAGVAPVHDAISSDLVLRNVNTGAFQVYNIADNQLMGSAPLGQVGAAWQLGGFAAIGFAPPPVEDVPPETEASTAQLVQAMAGFGGGGAAISNTAPLGTEASQQTLLTTPQHA
jgi:hypothetical protein